MLTVYGGKPAIKVDGVQIGDRMLRKAPVLKFTSTYIDLKAEKSGEWIVKNLKPWKATPNALAWVIVRNENKEYCRYGGVRPKGEEIPKRFDIPPKRAERVDAEVPIAGEDIEAPVTWASPVPLDESCEFEVYAEVADDVVFTILGWLEIDYS